jgi:hypothetical protein
MLKAKAIPIRPANADALKRLIADLDSDVYPRRASAMRALEQLGDLALSAMCARLKDDPPLETKRRLEELIAKNETAAPLPDIVRLLRAIEVLEQVNTAESRQILASLAEGADPHRVTTAARAALKGLRSR